MPSTTLTPAQLEALSARMDEREAQLGAEVRLADEERADGPGRAPNAEPGDAGDQGEARLSEAMRYAEKERDVVELRQIADARERIRQGSYGLCIDCDRPIPLARLEVQPFSERCVPCQEKYELGHAVGPHIPASSL